MLIVHPSPIQAAAAADAPGAAGAEDVGSGGAADDDGAKRRIHDLKTEDPDGGIA